MLQNHNEESTKSTQMSPKYPRFGQIQMDLLILKLKLYKLEIKEMYTPPSQFCGIALRPDNTQYKPKSTQEFNIAQNNSVKA